MQYGGNEKVATIKKLNKWIKVHNMKVKQNTLKNEGPKK
jgi:hypothetical protein